MDKNWLIRTKSNHILGPVSKEKVLELYQNGSIKPDDEVCSGNGYWFFIREEELVERFLLGSEAQGFNPISEAKDVITLGLPESTRAVSITDAIGTPKDDITIVGGLNLNMLKEQKQDAVPPTPEIPSSAESGTQSTPADTKKKNNVDQKPKLKVVPKAQQQAPLKKQNWLKLIGIIGFLLLFLMIYFRKSIIQHLFKGEITSTISLISEAHAQEETPAKKKSSLRAR